MIARHSYAYLFKYFQIFQIEYQCFTNSPKWCKFSKALKKQVTFRNNTDIEWQMRDDVEESIISNDPCSLGFLTKKRMKQWSSLEFETEETREGKQIADIGSEKKKKKLF